MKLEPYNSFGEDEQNALMWLAENALHDMPLSGYLAGRERGGMHVTDLEDDWARTFRVKHAIACNSATSGLLAAAFAIGLQPNDRFAVSAMTMSATAAAPMFTGAKPFFCDVEDKTFGMVGETPHDAPIFITNLFGHPADSLEVLRRRCDERNTVLIEDNSQSPFAYVRNKYAGTIGHIGVFSLNVHKPIQCGEGGIIVTDDDLFADRMRGFINHGEHVNGGEIGLNLRMPEVCAAIALAQLERGDRLIEQRIEQAEAIRAAIPPIPGLRMPVETPGVRNAYYTIPFLIDRDRTEFCAALRDLGVPVVEGYVAPLYTMRAFAKYTRPCPMAEDLHHRRLFYFENCAWDVSLDQAEEIGACFAKAAELVL